MVKIGFDKNGSEPKKILCLGAHSDDIEIGCGGTILRLASEPHPPEVYWVVFCASGTRKDEALRASELFLSGVPKKTVVVREFRDGFLPYLGGEVKEFFEEIKSTFSPDLIFTHYRDDLHQDHRLISELTWNTFRHHLILEYEIPKYDGDLGTPNFFVHLEERLCRRKVEHVTSAFVSQREKHWFAEETFLGLARLRGMESSSPGRYAEAFYCRKLAL